MLLITTLKQLSLLIIWVGVALSSLNAQATSFLSFDSRTMSLGGGGTASAEANEAVIFNPALLALYDNRDEQTNFLHAHIGARLLDRNNFIDRVKGFAEQKNENLLDSSLARIHELFELGQLEPDDIRQFTLNVRKILDDIESLSGQPLRAAASYGISFGEYRKNWGLGGAVRQYTVIGAQLLVSPTDLLRVRQVLSTADAVAGVVERTRDFEALLRESDFKEVISIIEQDAQARAVSQQLRAYTDIPSVARVISAMEALHFSLDDLDQYLDINGLFDALIAQNNGVPLQDIGLGHISLRDYLRYQIPETFLTSVEFSGADINEIALSAGIQVDEYPNLSLGFTAKFLSIDAIGFKQLINEVDFQVIKDGNNRRHHQRVNFDIGASYTINSSWLVGFVVKNLIPLKVSAPEGQEIDMDTIARAAIAYKTENFLWSLDYDLTRNEPLGFDPDKQYLTTGLAFRVRKSMMLRVGYRYNTVDHVGVPSLGIGLGTINGHIDIAATASDSNDEYGFSIQGGLRF